MHVNAIELFSNEMRIVFNVMCSWLTGVEIKQTSHLNSFHEHVLEPVALIDNLIESRTRLITNSLLNIQVNLNLQCGPPLLFDGPDHVVGLAHARDGVKTHTAITRV